MSTHGSTAEQIALGALRHLLPEGLPSTLRSIAGAITYPKSASLLDVFFRANRSTASSISVEAFILVIEFPSGHPARVVAMRAREHLELIVWAVDPKDAATWVADQFDRSVWPPRSARVDWFTDPW